METLCSFQPVGSCSMCVRHLLSVTTLEKQADCILKPTKLSFELQDKNIRICNVSGAFTVLKFKTGVFAKNKYNLLIHAGFATWFSYFDPYFIC